MAEEGANKPVKSIPWSFIRDLDRPKGELAMTAYLAAPEPQPTYVSKLDQLLNGGMTRGVTVIGGPPSAGKSVIACQCAAMMAAHGKRVVYASYEMSWDVVQLRCASAWSMIESSVRPFSWSQVVNGAERKSRPQYDGLSREQLSYYLVGSNMDPITHALTAWDEGPGKNLTVLTSSNDVHELCEAMSNIEGERPILIVDYLQIVPSGSTQEQSEYQRVTEVINALQSYAYSEHGSNVLAISSTRNLTAQDYKDGPNLGWYRGSGYVGFAAEQAVMLVHDRVKGEDGQIVPSRNEDGATEGKMTVIKNKSGQSNVSIPTLLYGWCNTIT